MTWTETTRRHDLRDASDLRAVVDALLCLVTTGCQGWVLPKAFPPSSTVRRFFYRSRADGLWDQINHDWVRWVGEIEGRDTSPTAGIIDSQSVKTTEAGGPRGDDAGKKINGRKRHLLTDRTGMLTAAIVHEANIQDRDGALPLPALAPPCVRRWRLCRQQARRDARQNRPMDA